MPSERKSESKRKKKGVLQKKKKPITFLRRSLSTEEHLEPPIKALGREKQKEKKARNQSKDAKGGDYLGGSGSGEKNTDSNGVRGVLPLERLDKL